MLNQTKIYLYSANAPIGKVQFKGQEAAIITLLGVRYYEENQLPFEYEKRKSSQVYLAI
jgi:hypothetical protein